MGYTERALRRISPIYGGSAFMEGLFNGASASFEGLRSYFERLREQRYIDTVDWGMAYQELKYSLEVRPDLSLEERRARLGIHARQHLPLNPAIMERFLRERFAFKCYLYEKAAGYITVYFNKATPESYERSISWLLSEKPAHLALRSIMDVTEYIGVGEEPDAINTPDEPARIDGTVPRLYAGVGRIWGGVANVMPSQPENELIKNTLSMVEVRSGEACLRPNRPNHSIVKIKCKALVKIGGEVTLR